MSTRQWFIVVYEQCSRIKCNVAWCFPYKSSWCLIEQVCGGATCFVPSSELDKGFTIIYSVVTGAVLVTQPTKHRL